MRLSTVGAALSRADLSAAASRGGSCWNCSGRKQSSPPFNWQLELFRSSTPPQISCVSAACEHLPWCFHSGVEGRQALLGPWRKVWGRPGLFLTWVCGFIEGQAQVAFSIWKHPCKEWYFQQVTFWEGRPAPGSRPAVFHPCTAVLSVTGDFMWMPSPCCMARGKSFGQMSSLRLKGT